MKRFLLMTIMLLGFAAMSTISAASATTDEETTSTYYTGTLTTKMASGTTRTTSNFEKSYITSNGTFGIEKFSIGSMPGTITVKADNFVADGITRTYKDAVSLTIFGGDAGDYDADIWATLQDGNLVYHIEVDADYGLISFTATVDFTGTAK